jgi:hypothetical protein
MSSRLLIAGAALLLMALFAACTITPSIRIDSDRSVDIAAYRTFGFPEQTGTDRGGYSTLVTSHFKNAVLEQMTRRGYTYTQENPQLLVNFYTNLRERTEARPSMTIGYGYYSYRWGLYQTWPLYPSGVDTVTYRIGTVNIDVIDTARQQLIWEGVVEGQVRETDMRNPQAGISRAVALVMQRFPRHVQM